MYFYKSLYDYPLLYRNLDNGFIFFNVRNVLWLLSLQVALITWAAFVTASSEHDIANLNDEKVIATISIILCCRKSCKSLTMNVYQKIIKSALLFIYNKLYIYNAKVTIRKLQLQLFIFSYFKFSVERWIIRKLKLLKLWKKKKKNMRKMCVDTNSILICFKSKFKTC